MTSFNRMSFILASLLGLLCLFCTSEAQSNQDCCLSYMRSELPRRVITGYMEQLSNEVCDISAIIFHTRNGLKACANPEDNWVKMRLLWLSKKLKKMSM
ncbi:C-C motif chemokine 20-like [Pelodiscus sinensis]|uniref:C-C motif chemokine 20-like n=1 Tax=Pelodiscus sinensis TaxID=13735 RepID=UPI000D72087B|nr:C-C motif chemokine 20-like [Pelodiscus sinensis]|eukprot:XP_006119971.2 C-C motif chemokine 20-like [Pelodiscus sinensis]